MSARQPHVLLLSPGAKVGLTRAWADAVKNRQGRLTAWEADSYAPAARFCQSVVAGGPLENPASFDRFQQWCRQEKPDLVVPTRHGDLTALAEIASHLRENGTTAAISTAACVALCCDKIATHAWLARSGHPMPEQTTVAARAASSLRDVFPVVAKDPRGSGSAGVRWCRNMNDLAGLSGDWLLQSIAPGVEFTVNTYLDRNGRSVCAIPHERLLVHEGEVVRARTVRNPVLMKLARQIAESLPGARGPLNIQIFWDDATARATVIEINPRFGGGYPLAHHAGGKFVDWLLQEHLDGEAPVDLDSWEENLLMVRYRDAVFYSNATCSRS